MKRTENKYFYFDNQPNIDTKFIIKYLVSLFERLFYIILINILRPSKKNDTKYKVSICSIFKDEGIYLKEWIEFHKIVGVDHFYLYNNNSSDNYYQILKPYIEQNIVTLIDWPKPQSQMEAYQDFMDRYSFETQWVGFIDLDEFVVPNKHDNIYEFLQNFENRPSVIIYWKMFGTSGLIKRNYDRLVTEDFTVSWSKFVNIGKFFFNTKYEYSPNYKKNEYMHSTWGKYKNVHLPPVNCFNKICLRGFHFVFNNEHPIQLNHYVIKSYEEYITKKHRRGGGVHPIGMHNLNYFFEHENKCQSTDYHAYKYLIKLKNQLKK